jgi:hypothetical protein
MELSARVLEIIDYTKGKRKGQLFSLVFSRFLEFFFFSPDLVEKSQFKVFYVHEDFVSLTEENH